MVDWFIRAKAFELYILTGDSVDGLRSASFSLERFNVLGFENNFIRDFSLTTGAGGGLISLGGDLVIVTVSCAMVGDPRGLRGNAEAAAEADIAPDGPCGKPSLFGPAGAAAVDIARDVVERCADTAGVLLGLLCAVAGSGSGIVCERLRRC